MRRKSGKHLIAIAAAVSMIFAVFSIQAMADEHTHVFGDPILTWQYDEAGNPVEEAPDATFTCTECGETVEGTVCLDIGLDEDAEAEAEASAEENVTYVVSVWYTEEALENGEDPVYVEEFDSIPEDTGLRIVTQPNGGEATYGQTVTISFEARNAQSYQWYYSKDGGESWTRLYWEGAKTNTLSVAYKASRSAFQYQCRVTGTDGNTLYTEPTSITLGTAPEVVINRQPETVSADIGETVSLTIDADNAVTYQWYYSSDNGSNWSKLYWEGAKTDTMTFEVTKSRYSYAFYCKLTDGNGNAYYSTRCYLRQKFVVTEQPQDVTAAIGDTVNLTVSAVGVQSYQWYYSSDNGTTWKKLSWTGAKSDTLSVDVTRTRCTYLYHCVLVGYDGTELTTNTVQITTAE